MGGNEAESLVSIARRAQFGAYTQRSWQRPYLLGHGRRREEDRRTGQFIGDEDLMRDAHAASLTSVLERRM